MFFSIAIPCYEMNNKGVEFLNHNLNILNEQSFKDFEIVISDHSLNNDIFNLCNEWKNKLNINYIPNKENYGSSSANINNALKNSKGSWIKILFQDDFLYDNNSLKDLKDFIINNNKEWYVTACIHSNDGITLYREFYPTWNPNIHLGINTISSPSVVTIKNTNDKLYFDNNLIWLMDVDFYKKYYNKYNYPGYFNNINIVNRTWEHSVSNTINENVKKTEIDILKERYKNDNN